MHESPREQSPLTRAPKGGTIKVPPEYWDDLKKLDPENLCERSLATPKLPEGFQIRFLNDDVLIDMENHCLWRLSLDQHEKIEHPLLELVFIMIVIGHIEIGRILIS